jgi:hypothetical protein
MNRLLLVLGMLVTIVAVSVVSNAQTAAGDEHSQFRFEFQQTESHRGLAVEGWAYNGLPWRITNVRVRVDSVDTNGTVIASAAGWVLGDVNAGGRGYFYVPVSSPAPTYRVSVQSFDKVAPEAPTQAP